MKIVWSAQARRELVEHYEFYFRRNPTAARRVRQAVMDAASRLRDFPKMGKPGRVAGTRELVISSTPFLLVYDMNGDRVEIVHVFHGRQDWQSDQ